MVLHIYELDVAKALGVARVPGGYSSTGQIHKTNFQTIMVDDALYPCPCHVLHDS